MEDWFIDPYFLLSHVVLYSGPHLALLVFDRGGENCSPLAAPESLRLPVTAHDYPSLLVTAMGACIYDSITPNPFRSSTNVSCFRQSARMSCLHPRLWWLQETWCQSGSSKNVKWKTHHNTDNNSIYIYIYIQWCLLKDLSKLFLSLYLLHL